MLRRGDIQSIEDFLRVSAVEEERTGKFCRGGMAAFVLAAIKLRRPSFFPTSLALYGTEVPPDGKMGEVSSVSADLGPFLPSSRIELFVVSRLMEDRRITESFLA
jgi:L-rhamnose isomerase